jgi:heme/copper-type cytochrome/quinol oxidase subunit 2
MRSSVLFLSAVLLIGGAASPGRAATTKPTALPVLNVTATSEQKFSPDHLVLHVGKRQTLRFTSSGGVHGVASTDLGIPATTIAPGQPVSVVVVPKKAGTYKINCTIVCGPGHADMLLTIVVKP